MVLTERRGEMTMTSDIRELTIDELDVVIGLCPLMRAANEILTSGGFEEEALTHAGIVPIE
jgi:hypothetical protein